MKIEIIAGEILKALNIVNHVRTKRSHFPILDCVLIRIENQELVLSRTNLTLSITTRIMTDGNADAGILAPANELTQLFSKFPSDHLIHIETSTDQLTIRSAFGEYHFAGMPVDDFPRIRCHDRADEIILNTEQFADGVNRVAFCASLDVSRPALNGILWSMADKIMAAVDGHRLAWNKSDLQSTKQTTVIVPPETLISVAAIVKGSLDFFVSFNDRHVTFRSNNTEIASNLIEGPYPDINQIIPTNHGTVLLVDKQPLMDAIDRLAITADDLTHKIHFAISEKQLLLSSEKADSGRRATESLECELIGKKLEIAFNLLYLANILKHIETQKIRIEMTGPMNATIFRPVDISEYFYLIMPLRYE